MIGDNICWNIGSAPLSNCASASGLLIENPLFCDAAAESFGLCANSPAVVGETALYGAFGVECAACNPAPVVKKSWGSMKALFGGRCGSAESDSTAAGADQYN